MPLGEFQLIQHYFQQQGLHRADVRIGIGDDGAVVEVAGGQELVLVIDTLVAGVHFPLETRPEDIGWKALAVNLSDLAAMGAEPAWFTLALTLPHSDADWLANFSRGMFELAAVHKVELIGGDTTRGPLTVTVQAHGLVPWGRALLRSGASAGDRIFVSGSVGEAGLALQLLRNQQLDHQRHAALLRRLNRPVPQIGLGMVLREVASACIDLSDGLLADLAHILEASSVGATIHIDKLPLSNAYRSHAQGREDFFTLPLHSGDDYELIFTIAPANLERFYELARQGGFDVTEIGEIRQAPGLDCYDAQGKHVNLSQQGYDHFTGESDGKE